MLELLKFVLSGYVDKSALDGDSVESLDKDRQKLKQDTLAQSYLPATSASRGGAEDAAAERKVTNK